MFQIVETETVTPPSNGWWVEGYSEDGKMLFFGSVKLEFSGQEWRLVGEYRLVGLADGMPAKCKIYNPEFPQLTMHKKLTPSAFTVGVAAGATVHVGSSGWMEVTQ